MFSMAHVLQTKLDDGLIDLGQRGEVVMRLLLRNAYMEAIVVDQGPTNPNFSRGCSLLCFLKALFAPQNHTSVMDCGPDENFIRPSTLANTFKNAVVRFTHFVKASDGFVMTTEGMFRGFLRGSATVGQNNQEAIDIAIPILLDKDEKIDETSMSAFLIQVKRRQQAGAVNAYHIDGQKLGFFCKEDTRPYVTLVAELGVKAPPPPVLCVVTSKPVERESDRIAGHSSGKHPRYAIRAYGCTNQAWHITPRDQDCYTHILSADELLADHPRQDPASLQLVRQMLPFWSRDAAWVSAGEHEATEAESMTVD